MKYKENIILFILLLMGLIGCTNQSAPDTNQTELLMLVSESFSDSTKALYHKTMRKEKIVKYIGSKITREFLSVNPVFSDANIDSIFTKQDFNELNENFGEYRSYTLDTLKPKVPYLVTEKQIPEFIKTKAPPIGEVDFYNVVYISTPITTSNRALIFTQSTSSHSEMVIHFFVLENGKWQRIGWTFTYPGILNEE